MKETSATETTPSERDAIPSESKRRDHVVCWSTPRLMALVPGSTRRTWYVVLIPALLAAGALRRRGRRWYGRQSDIEAAVMGHAEVAPPKMLMVGAVTPLGKADGGS